LWSASVQRLRFGAGDITVGVAEIRGLVAARGRTAAAWTVGPSATPAGLLELLLAMGMQAESAAGSLLLVLTEPPHLPSSPFEVRLVACYQDHLAAPSTPPASGSEASEQPWRGPAGLHHGERLLMRRQAVAEPRAASRRLGSAGPGYNPGLAVPQPAAGPPREGFTLAATVLVADDDADILRFVEINLRLEGFEVVTARDGLDALAKAVTVWPDLVLLDVRMPSLDGYTICARIRADPRLAAIPVIMVTANYGSADLGAARQAGADDFLVKPFLPATLLDMAKAMLS
jgi:CheY-like chemotaxis protein